MAAEVVHPQAGPYLLVQNRARQPGESLAAPRLFTQLLAGRLLSLPDQCGGMAAGALLLHSQAGP